MRNLSPPFKYGESFYKVLYSGKNEGRRLGSSVLWYWAVAHGRHSLGEENTTGMGLSVMESTKNLTWDGIGPVELRAWFERREGRTGRTRQWVGSGQ